MPTEKHFEPLNLRDYGFAEEEISEIVEFYLALARMGQKHLYREQLVRVLHGHFQQLIDERRKNLLAELSGLEKL